MTEKLLWLDKHKAPVRNGREGFEFAADCGTKQIVVEIDKEITDGLGEGDAQELLCELRPKIEAAARRRYQDDGAYPESTAPGVTRYRIAITSDDLSIAD